MRIVNFIKDKKDNAGLVIGDKVFPLDGVNTKFNKNWNTTVQDLIDHGDFYDLLDWYKDGGLEKLKKSDEFYKKDELKYGPLYRKVSRIWGIGLNYRDHAKDLAEKTPSSIPASFIKNQSTICGPDDDILLPIQSEKVTAEAELGVIIGKDCRDIEEENWLDYVAGFTTVLDQTAEDILRLNPRYLTMVKNYDTFFSFGPELVSIDEIEDISKLKVKTMINGNIHAQNYVSNMTFSPSFLVSFYSKVFTWKPGDILSTGTPRAVHIQDGDKVSCQIDGFESLVNGVVDLKKRGDK